MKILSFIVYVTVKESGCYIADIIDQFCINWIIYWICPLFEVCIIDSVIFLLITMKLLWNGLYCMKRYINYGICTGGHY